MDDLLVVAVVMAVPVLLVAELRRVLVSYFLNRSIQKAPGWGGRHHRRYRGSGWGLRSSARPLWPACLSRKAATIRPRWRSAPA